MAKSDNSMGGNFALAILAPIALPILAIMFLNELNSKWGIGNTKKEPENISFFSKAIDTTQSLIGVGTAALATTCFFSPPVMAACATFLGVSTGMAVPAAIIGIGIATSAALSFVSSLAPTQDGSRKM